MRTSIPSTVLAVGFVAVASGQAPVPPQTSTPQIMREKLEHAEQLLRALILAELEEARTRADELYRLSELQSWYVLPTPEYDEHSKGFREAARSVSGAAERGDGDAAFESYSAAIRECMACHEYMRRVRGDGERSFDDGAFDGILSLTVGDSALPGLSPKLEGPGPVSIVGRRVTGGIGHE